MEMMALEPEQELIQWHPGFYGAMELELAENRDELIFEQEHVLNKKPLLIDMLVIKKQPGALIKNEIGRFFRGHNLLEYKAPDDTLNVKTWHKVMAYAHLYTSYAGELDSNDVTLTLVRESKPENLLTFFKSQGYEVRQTYKGIYQVEGAIFPIQIIAGGELDADSHIWLPALTRKLDKQGAERLLRNVDNIRDEAGRNAADAVIHVAINANKDSFDRWREEEPNMYASLMEFMKPDIDEKIDKTVNQTKIEFAESLIEDTDLPDTQIAKSSKLPIAQVREIRSRLGMAHGA